MPIEIPSQQLTGSTLLRKYPHIWRHGAEKPRGVRAAIAAASSVEYLGFLVGPPVIGSLAGVVGLRVALALVVGAGAVISLSARKVLVDA
jgi:hypothetical protein